MRVSAAIGKDGRGTRKVEGLVVRLDRGSSNLPGRIAWACWCHKDEADEDGTSPMPPSAKHALGVRSAEQQHRVHAS